MGVGAWAWGERLYWGYGRSYGEADLRAAFEICINAGINFFDTAESYGRGHSERLLGRFVSQNHHQVVIATKFMPYPWRLWQGRLLSALIGSAQRLGVAQVDLYQIHWSFPPVSIKTWGHGLAEAIERGLARAVGVSNYNSDQMRLASSVLAERGLSLASNQVEYNLLNRKVEFNGLLELCRKMGVTLIAYSPLAQGLLTGKYTPENPPPGVRAIRLQSGLLIRVQPLIELMRAIGRAHGGKTRAQVAINWTICKGALPIPGVKNAHQAEENAGALGWRLDAAEVAALDQASWEATS